MSTIGTVAHVRSALDALCLEPHQGEWSNKEWTGRIKSAVIKLAHDAGHQAYASDVCEADGGEWLYDLSWLDYSHEEYRLARTVLVLECEWSWEWEQIVYDFLKLLVARADLRVMVFQAVSQSKCEDIFNCFVSLIRQCEQSCQGDRYLLSGWVKDSRRFTHCEYVHGMADL